MQLKVRSDQSERFEYTSAADFPVYANPDGHLGSFPDFTTLAHWHDDLEFTLMLSGEKTCCVNGRHVRVAQGNGLFINSRQLHYDFSPDKTDSHYLCLLVHPMLLCASPYVERTFVEPVLSGAPPYLLLEKDGWAAGLCRLLREAVTSLEGPAGPLRVQAKLWEIWEELYARIPRQAGPPQPRSQSLHALQSMVAFIQKNYKEKLTLEDIARVGNVSKTTCCKIFNRYSNQSPLAYLIGFRLRKGMELLLSTDMTVTEVCFEAGFSGPSYFSESFRKAFGCSPLEYRKKRALPAGAPFGG